MSDSASAARRRQVWGRQRGHSLRPRQQQLVAEWLPRVALSVPAVGAIDPKELFPTKPRSLWFEIGFGGGEHLAAQAAAHGDVGLIGCEPYINGVAQLLARVADQRLDNVRIAVEDARLVLAALPDQALDRIFVLFPDPWPKRRHHKRRIIGPQTMPLLARVLATGGELRFASDHPEMCRWVLHHVLAHPGFVWTARSAHDWRDPPDDWAPTRYEAKARRRDAAIAYLRFTRTAA